MDIHLYDARISPQPIIQRLGVWINKKLGFKAHASHVSSQLHQSTGQLWRINKRKGVTLSVLHYLASSVSIPNILWGSEIWWTGAPHLTSCMAPAFNTIPRIITGRPKWTPLRKLLPEAGLPPLNLLLDLHSRHYEVPVLQAPDDHPCKPILRDPIGTTPSTHKVGCGLRRIADLIHDMIPATGRIKADTTHHLP